MKAVAYTRVSTDRQARENLSLEGQRKQIADYCTTNDIDLVEVFTDAGESAKTAERPELRRSLEYCRKNPEVGLYIVWKLDRFSRNTADHASMKLLLQKMGIVLRSVTEPIDESPAGNLMATILSGFSQFDNEVRGQRSSDGVRRRIEEGGWPHAAPIGYDNVRDIAGRPTLQINDTGQIIRDLIREFLKGGMSVRQLHSLLYENGVRSKVGKKVSYQTVVNILRNKIYAGMVYSKMISNPIEGLHEGIITKSEFYRLQAILDGRNQKFEVANKEEWPLRGGFVKCHHCGNSLTGSSPRGRSKKYPKYHCTRCSARVLGHTVSVDRELLHLKFIQLLEEIRPSDIHVRLFKEVFLAKWNSMHAHQISEQVRINKLLGELRERKTRVIELFIDGSLTREEKEVQVARIDADILRYEMVVSESRDDVRDAEAVLDFGTELMSNASHLWEMADLKNRQRLQQAIFPEGLTYSFVDGFGTVQTSDLYEAVRQFGYDNSNLVGINGTNWNQLYPLLRNWYTSLHDIDQNRLTGSTLV